MQATLAVLKGVPQEVANRILTETVRGALDKTVTSGVSSLQNVRRQAGQYELTVTLAVSLGLMATACSAGATSGLDQLKVRQKLRFELPQETNAVMRQADSTSSLREFAGRGSLDYEYELDLSGVLFVPLSDPYSADSWEITPEPESRHGPAEGPEYHPSDAEIQESDLLFFRLNPFEISSVGSEEWERIVAIDFDFLCWIEDALQASLEELEFDKNIKMMLPVQKLSDRHSPVALYQNSS